MDAPTAQALIRFGLGPKFGESLPDDPRAWLKEQIRGCDCARICPSPQLKYALPVVHSVLYRGAHAPDVLMNLFKRDSVALLDNCVETSQPFRERLVWFWANHFSVSIQNFLCSAFVGAFFQEAIRPHITGTFEQMLIAVMRHPAMLTYLDNAGSVGPRSIVGRLRGRGINENLARECLELHTVTPKAGYTQHDVVALAKLMTGYNYSTRWLNRGFSFRRREHEPGEKTVLGRSFPSGEHGLVQALKMLATHPATHRSLARKLACHFIADVPPLSSVRVIEGALRDTNGNLGAAAEALIGIDEAWKPLTKFRTPWDFGIAAVRAMALDREQRRDLTAIFADLGQPIFAAPQPDGWPDDAAYWATSEGLMRRIEWAYKLASRRPRDATDVAVMSLGPFLREATRREMASSASMRDALTILLAAPEFQRR